MSTIQKLFTYEYFNSNAYSIIAMNPADGMLYLIKHIYDGGADGSGEETKCYKLEYQHFNNIVNRKTKHIKDLFGNLNESNWQEYIGVTYNERQTDSRAFFVAVINSNITRIAVSRQSNPYHNVIYITCPTKEYLHWKSSHADLFDCLCDYKSLKHIANEFKEKSHSPFKARKYSFFVEQPQIASGNIDAVISLNRSTEIFEYNASSLASATEYIDSIAKKCKRSPNQVNKNT
jgi:hypothetical protein